MFLLNLADGTLLMAMRVHSSDAPRGAGCCDPRGATKQAPPERKSPSEPR